MTKDDAIETLHNQLSEVDNLNENTYKNWKTQTASYIKEFLGASSDEYELISKFSFIEFYDDSSTLTQVRKRSPQAKDFIRRAISTIERIGIVNKPEPEPKLIKQFIKKNFLQSFDNGALITILIFALPLIFGAGWYFGERKADVKNIELRVDNKTLKSENEKLKLSASPLEEPNNVTNNDTSRNKNKIGQDTTHKLP